MSDYKDGLVVINDIHYYYKNNKKHNDDGPAVIYRDGSVEYWVNGNLHSEDRPAVLNSNGTEEWWYNGRKHRADGPAVIKHYNNTWIEEWWYNGNLHREDGPAIKTFDYKEWFCHGLRHREDGPADISITGSYYNIEQEEDVIIIRYCWWNKGVRHRDNGPVIISKEYITNKYRYTSIDEIDIEEGKIVEEVWIQDKVLHRICGPSINYNGDKSWYLYGISMSESKYNRIMNYMILFISKMRRKKCLPILNNFIISKKILEFI